MDDFTELVDTEGFDDYTMRTVKVGHHEYLVARVMDEFYVADAACPHLGGHLSEGKLDGLIVSCPRNHSRFDISDGRIVKWTDWPGAVLPAAQLVHPRKGLRVYEVKVADGKVWVGPEKPPLVTEEY